MEIEAGKYYRTRDGRKVGPMRHLDVNDGFPFTENALYGSWSIHGIRQNRDEPQTNLIAEWTDEPKTTPHFTHMLAELQGIAEKYGYTIEGISTCDDTLAIDLILTN